MDFFAHLFWTAIVFKSHVPLWIPLFFAAIPDISSWGVIMIHMIVCGKMKFDKKHFKEIPAFAWTLYGATHSIFSFAFVFGILTLLTGKIFIAAFAWLLHLLIDILTHSRYFLGTPFLWPFSDWKFPGYSWGRLWFTILNWAAIIFFIIYFFVIKGQGVVLF